MSVRHALLITAMAAVAAGAGAAHGQASRPFDFKSPLIIDYDGEGGYDPDSCTSPMRGRVELKQERTRLRANAITAYYERRGGGRCGNVNRLDARGEVFYVTPEQTVRADNAIYDAVAETATFTGNVVAVRGQDVSTGQRLVVNLATGGFTMSGGVRGVIYPEGAQTR